MIKWDIFKKIETNALISTVLFFLAECQRAVIDVAIYIKCSCHARNGQSCNLARDSLCMLILVVTYYRFKKKILYECHILVLQLIFLLLFNNSIVGRYKIWTTTIYNTLNI